MDIYIRRCVSKVENTINMDDIIVHGTANMDDVIDT